MKNRVMHTKNNHSIPQDERYPKIICICMECRKKKAIEDFMHFVYRENKRG